MEPRSYNGPDIEKDNKIPNFLRNERRKLMKKIEFKSNVIRYTEIKGYIFELQAEFDNLMYTAIWIFNPQYGIKMHCISAEMTEEEIQTWLKNEADRMIRIYKADVED